MTNGAPTMADATRRRAADRRLGWLLAALGAVLALAVQVAAPVGVPLYDGVVVQEPYRFLHPTGDQAGTPTSFSSSPTLAGTQSPQFAAATAEQPPQAQLIAQLGAFALTEGITALNVSITPVDPALPVPSGSIAGNAYRFSVTDQSGRALTINRCQGCISLVMRAPDGTGDATLMRLENGAWSAVETIHAGMVAMYQTNPLALGDYAVVTSTGSGPFDLEPVLVLGGALVVLAISTVMFMLRRGRPGGPDAGARGTPAPTAGPIPPRSRSRGIPTKRKATRRPPDGRPD